MPMEVTVPPVAAGRSSGSCDAFAGLSDESVLKKLDALRRERAQEASKIQELFQQIQTLEEEAASCGLRREELLRQETLFLTEAVASSPGAAGSIGSVDADSPYLQADDGEKNESRASTASTRMTLNLSELTDSPASVRSSMGPQQYDMEEDLDEHQVNSPGGVEKDSFYDMEDHLDAVGVARCKYCLVRLPLDMDAIEEHSEECRKLREAEEAARICRCQRCGEQIASDIDAIEKHTVVCKGAARSFAPRDRRCWRIT